MNLVDRRERELIRTELDRNVVVEAAAGTGKTTELVSRIVALVARGGDIARIAALTFTEKAAGELKLRLRAELERARDAAQGEPRGSLEHALLHLEESRISTIHGFCSDLLRERPVEGRVDPQFATLSEAQAELLASEAFARWLDEARRAPPPGVRRALRRRTAGGRLGGEGPVDRLRRAAFELAIYRDYPAPWKTAAFDRPSRTNEVLLALEAFATVSSRPKNDRDRFHRDTAPARDAWAAIESSEALHSRDLDEVEAILCDLGRQRGFKSPGRGWGKAYGEGPAGPVERAEVEAAHARLVLFLERYARDAEADVAGLLSVELREVGERYEAMKRKSGALDFEDLLLRARDLLVSSKEARVAFQQRFTQILVDEFQDTDPLQAEILVLLASDDPDVDDYRRAVPRPGKLFVVGDPKQAIYRFRRADIEIYLDVVRQLEAHGALLVRLTSSFRAVPSLQRAINAAFAPVMDGDPEAQQAPYVPLAPVRPELGSHPTVITLPVPDPYGVRKLSLASVDASLPEATAAWVEWLLTQSGLRVTERSGGEPVPVRAAHVCLLFRQLERFGEDRTRPYVQALEARGIPQVLVGGRSLYAREEVVTMVTALTAIEWPDDELSVFATLRGAFFGIGDEALFEYRARYGAPAPLHLPCTALPLELAPIGDALGLLGDLHRARNRRTIADTIARLLAATRAHAGFALRPSGEQVLANVLHFGELARSYEVGGGLSFRGFVDHVREEAERRGASEAPVLEEGSEGVRLMTVHKAKGLEFPVVVLTELSSKIAWTSASRTIVQSERLCAMRLAGCAPLDLVEREPLELTREAAEGVRIAYVAATRARDLLVIPAVGDRPTYPDRCWLEPLLAAIAPAPDTPHEARVPGVRAIFSSDSVRRRPDGESRLPETVRPGRYLFPDGYAVAWWDPALLDLEPRAPMGVRGEELLSKSVDAAVVAADLERARAFTSRREETRRLGRAPSLRVVTATERAIQLAPSVTTAGVSPIIATEATKRIPGRPAGARFGSLVHAVLSLVALDAPEEDIRSIAELEAALLGATRDEVAAATSAAAAALAHPLMRRAHTAERRGQCRRETPVTIADAEGNIVEGVVDLAFAEGDEWVVVDFKTDADLERDRAAYERQVAAYVEAIEAATGRAARGVLFSV